MFKLTLIVILTAFSLVNNAFLEKRSIGGVKAKRGQLPYLAQIWSDTDGIFFCTASIIGKKWIITAAHCIKNDTTYSARLGEVDKFEYSPEYNIVKMIIHKDWHNPNKKDKVDLVLLKVDREIEFTAYVKPILLTDSPTTSNISVLMAGWGQEKNKGPGSRYLRYIVGTALTFNDCKARVPWIHDSEICARALPNEGVCYGDSGGPLVANNKLIGVLANFGKYSESPCASEYPDRYVDVYKLLPWIKKHTHK